MKLTQKLTAALFVGICFVLALNAWFRVAREIELFETETKRDHHQIARALAVAVAEVWRVEGEARALELVSRVNEAESHLTIRWVRLDGTRADARPAFDFARDLAGELVHVDHSVSPRRIVTWMPVAVPDVRGAIELDESLVNERAYVRATILRFGLYTTLMAVISGGIAMALGITFVGRPVSRLIDQARRIGRGDLSTRLDLRQRDEVGELAREMNLMCDRLVEANERASAETAARIATIEQLRHADRLMTVGKLASGIAHELGTPLNVVSGRAKLILEDPSNREGVAENARIIADQAVRITQIVRQLLDFARRRTPRKEPHDVLSLAEQTATLLKPLAEKQRVQVRVEGEHLQAQVDAGQFQQALTNLVVNGIQAMPGGGELVVRAARRRAPPPADIGGSERDCTVLEVVDRGIGIDDTVRVHLFEPFFTTKEVGHGTGLGLSVTWGIVREHGGWIDVESAPGHGSTFRICLPSESTA